MDPCKLSISISAFANAISCKLTVDELNLLGAILSQLGDTLNMIAMQRSICEENDDNVKNMQDNERSLQAKSKKQKN